MSQSNLPLQSVHSLPHLTPPVRALYDTICIAEEGLLDNIARTAPKDGLQRHSAGTAAKRFAVPQGLSHQLFKSDLRGLLLQLRLHIIGEFRAVLNALNPGQEAYFSRKAFPALVRTVRFHRDLEGNFTTFIDTKQKCPPILGAVSYKKEAFRRKGDKTEIKPCWEITSTGLKKRAMVSIHVNRLMQRVYGTAPSSNWSAQNFLDLFAKAYNTLAAESIMPRLLKADPAFVQSTIPAVHEGKNGWVVSTVMPFLPQDLQGFMANQQELVKLPFERIFAIAKDMTRTLALVHHNGFSHGDIKPPNFLFTQTKLTETKQLVLTDFSDAGPSHWVDIQGGTPEYLAPEALQALLHAELSGKPDDNTACYAKEVRAQFSHDPQSIFAAQLLSPSCFEKPETREGVAALSKDLHLTPAQDCWALGVTLLKLCSQWAGHQAKTAVTLWADNLQDYLEVICPLESPQANALRSSMLGLLSVNKQTRLASMDAYMDLMVADMNATTFAPEPMLASIPEPMPTPTPAAPRKAPLGLR